MTKQMQIIIDGCKREYEIDGDCEIKRISQLPCMNPIKEIETDEGGIKKVRNDFPMFMKYTRTVPMTKNGKELPPEEILNTRRKIKNRIDPDLVCPMNWLQDALDSIPRKQKRDITPTDNFIEEHNGWIDTRQTTKVMKLVKEYDDFVRANWRLSLEPYFWQMWLDKMNELVEKVSKIKFNGMATISRLVQTALGFYVPTHPVFDKMSAAYARKLLNIIYKTNREKFLKCFKNGQI